VLERQLADLVPLDRVDIFRHGLQLGGRHELGGDPLDDALLCSRFPLDLGQDEGLVEQLDVAYLVVLLRGMCEGAVGDLAGDRLHGVGGRSGNEPEARLGHLARACADQSGNCGSREVADHRDQGTLRELLPERGPRRGWRHRRGVLESSRPQGEGVELRIDHRREQVLLCLHGGLLLPRALHRGPRERWRGLASEGTEPDDRAQRVDRLHD
jgi:hypothetical protein